MIHQLLPISTDNTPDNNQGDASAYSTRHEEDATADTVDEEERGEGAQAVDDAVDPCCEEGGLSPGCVSSAINKDAFYLDFQT